MEENPKPSRWFFTRFIVVNFILLELLSWMGVHPPFNLLLLILLYQQFALFRIVGRQRQVREKYEQILAAQAKLFPDDQIPSEYAVNDALMALTEQEGDDLNAAGTIIRYLSRMSAMQLDAVEYAKRPRPGGSFLGFTPEMGNIRVRDGEEDPKVVSHGFNRKRIGQFVLTRNDRMLVYRYFWKPTPFTAIRVEEAADGWVLLFDPATMEYVGFANLVATDPTEDSPVVRLGLEFVHGQHKGEVRPLVPLM
jgi:hypothetical protein